jgi:dolichol-phosphate mannosyltransferase
MRSPDPESPEPASGSPLFSIIVPMKNEAENIPQLAEEIDAACTPIGPFEAIFVDDGSDDATPDMLAQARARHAWLRSVRHARSCGQSAAVATGIGIARAPLICTIDGDGQNPPAEIPKLLGPLLAADRPARLALVCGVRIARADTASKRLGSRLANAVRQWLLRDGAPDTGCGLKAFTRAAFLPLPYFDHMHRYLPSLFLHDGWQVAHVPVNDRRRQAGTSKYGNVERALVGAVDLFGVWWLMRRRKLPQIEPGEPPAGAT